MFNSPRPASAAPATNLGASYLNNNPLSSSAYGDPVDPWSNAPTPPPPASASPFGFLVSESSLPTTYRTAFALVDPTNSGLASLSSLHRVIATSGLSASTLGRIVNLVSSEARVSKMEFFVALALVALAQSGQDISIEQVASLAQQNSLPEPKLDLTSVSVSTASSAFSPSSPQALIIPTPTYSAVDAWSTVNTAPLPITTPSAHQGTGLPKGWWTRQETVRVNVHGQQGFILNRYTVYQLQSDRGGSVLRRYSEFAFLWDCLARRYPFRLLPVLPPKRIGVDEVFIENRRKALTRMMDFIVNHPVLKEDGLVAVFLSEPSLEHWRKHTAINLDEESSSKRLDRVEEMSIPSDLEEKLSVVRRKLGAVIEHWQRICLLAERLTKRREAAAADLTRLMMSINSLNEANADCWRGDTCNLCAGVRQGLERASGSLQTHASNVEQRAAQMSVNTLEMLKGQRDLFLAMRELFVRHDRLSVDNVERLKKRVETFGQRLEGVKAAKKEGWAVEADRIVQSIEQDQAAIAAQLARRVFIRYCMWHELRVVLHNRENALLSQGVHLLGRDEREFADAELGAWTRFCELVDNMPFE